MTWISMEEAAALERVNPATFHRRVVVGKKYVTKREGRRRLVFLPSLSAAAQGRRLVEETASGPEDVKFSPPEANEKQLSLYNRRLAVIERLQAHRGPGFTALMEQIAREEGVTYMTVLRWYKTAREKGIQHLCPRGRSDKGERKFNEDVKEKAVALYFYESKPSIIQTYRALSVHFKEKNVPVPSYPTLSRFIDDWARNNPQDAYAHRFGIRAARQKFGVYIPRDMSYLAPNDLWMGDHHEADVLVINPKTGKPDRPWVTAWLDVRSRVLMGHHISFQPASQTIALALKHAITREQFFGIPSQVYIDNGKDYRARMFGGAERDLGKIDLNIDTKTVFSTLGVSVTYALPYNARSKAMIERWFGTLEHGWMNLLPGYVGSNPKERPEKLQSEIDGGRLLSLIQFKEKFADAVNAYHHRPHSGLDGKAPLEFFMENWDRIERIEAPNLELLLMKKKVCTIQRDGIFINGKRYFSWDNDFILCIGKKAVVRYDPGDPRWINVSCGESHFGKIFCAEAARFGDGEAMAAAMRVQKAQEKRWRRTAEKNEDEKQELNRILIDGQNAEVVKVETKEPKKRIHRLTGLEEKIQSERRRDEQKEADAGHVPIYRFKKGVV
jgi:putative transposase